MVWYDKVEDETKEIVDDLKIKVNKKQFKDLVQYVYNIRKNYTDQINELESDFEIRITMLEEENEELYEKLSDLEDRLD